MSEHKDAVKDVVAFAAMSENDVVSVYSGKYCKRCYCGVGKHSYNPAHQELAGTRRGRAVSSEECNLSMIRKVVRILKANVDAVSESVGPRGETTYSVVVGARIYIAYML